MTNDQIKALVRQRDGNRCVRCGLTSAESIERYGFDLDVHRVTPGSPYSLDPGAAETLCRRCHGPMPKRPYGQRFAEEGSVFARIDDAIGEALDAYLKAQRPRPTMTAVLETALEDFLRAKGFLPPQGEGGGK